MTIEEFNSFNLTKKARIFLEEGKWLGDTVDGLGVYHLHGFYVIADEDLECGSLPSYVCVKSAIAVEEKPYIHDPFDDDEEWRINKP